MILALGQGLEAEAFPSELLDKSKTRLSCDPLTLQSAADPAVFVPETP